MPVESDSDAFDETLRPQNLDEYVGQTAIKSHLSVYLQAAKKRTEPLGHTILHGPPGLGKTTLAYILAKEMNAQMRVTSGPAIEKPGDLASLLTNLQKGDMLFIDEIHRMRPAIEEVLYSAMEDYALDLVIGKGPSARSMRIDLQPFTLIGATTKAGAVSMPLRDRFIHNFRLQFYTTEEIKKIILRTSRIFGIPIVAEAAEFLAQASRATPRISNRLMRAVRDFAQVNEEPAISVSRVKATLLTLGIDERGLDNTDRLILLSIIEKFGGGPVGLGALAAVLSDEQETLEDVYEPYLLQCGYLQRTPKGRVVTKMAYELLGMSLPEKGPTLF
ncbi:Holliday junction DNA helicase RuvB [Candidatus Peribacteria bacterium RIFCSPLOWO2_01_FULL_51_18]|nr:MAG: Holliday junction DNA helicase RuvB [Candidatus Peribacteria bacterium RIFCSPHIGHO2_02_FULL_51_15]OGJ66081.1 MAG: Holliday junction DNA helicase RuvB [Candidatus Peribacteria bacterium RIFCSPLOWO2_01_FULL_51_18]OGJ69891.1 MAG: Holliday junction DNA helicase RuvB [Candidatus Peribacteria bacterium RIFCSPLOWO2_02_FULL_51_10]